VCVCVCVCVLLRLFCCACFFFQSDPSPKKEGPRSAWYLSAWLHDLHLPIHIGTPPLRIVFPLHFLCVFIASLVMMFHHANYIAQPSLPTWAGGSRLCSPRRRRCSSLRGSDERVRRKGLEGRRAAPARRVQMRPTLLKGKAPKRRRG